MSLEDRILKVAHKEARESFNRVEDRIFKAAVQALSRPSSRLRPDLTLVGEPPEGAQVFGYVSSDPYGGPEERIYVSDLARPVWRAAYGDVVAYAQSAEDALDEFDFQMQRKDRLR